MEKEGENQKMYELGYLFVPTISEEAIGAEAFKVISILESSGHIVSSKIPEKRKLEYDISKVIANKKIAFSSGYFGFVIFQTEAGKLADIKAELEKNENILRFIIINRSKSSLIVAKKKVPAIKKPTTIFDKKVSGNKSNVKIDEVELDKSIEELIIN